MRYLLTISMILTLMTLSNTIFSAKYAIHTIAIDTSPTFTFDSYFLKGGGASLDYEFRVLEFLTINPNFGYGYYSVPNYEIDTNNNTTNRLNDIIVQKFIPTLTFRYYFNGAAPVGSWVSTGFGMSFDFASNDENIISFRLPISLGYKMTQSEKNGWFIDPYFTYNFVFTTQLISFFSMGIKAGYAF